MIAGAGSKPELLTLRALRRDLGFEPGGEGFAEVVQRHLPLVYGPALALIPENPAAAELVSIAVFETLAFRWRKLSRRTVLTTWLLRTVWFASARDRKRLGLGRKPETPKGVIGHGLLKQINALKPRHANAFVLTTLLREPIEMVAAVLRSKPTRIAKRIAKANRKLDKRFRKLATIAARKFPAEAQQIGAVAEPATTRSAADLNVGCSVPPHPGPLPRGEGEAEPLYCAIPPLRTIAAPVPPGVEASILARIREWSPGTPRPELVRSTISAWRRRTAGRWIGRLAAASGIMLLLAAVSIGALWYLLEQGYLNLVFINWQQFKELRRFPEIAQSAKPWPRPALPEISRLPPGNPGEFYQLTNVWLAKIRMSSAQWRAVQPVHVRPVPKLFEDGRIKLHNPNASRNGLAGALGLDLPWSEGSFEVAGQTFDHVGVRFRGNGSYVSSLQLNKQSYKVDLNRIEKGQRVAGITTLNFINALVDYSYLHEVLAEQLFRELGAVAPRTAYAYLTIDVPGKFANQPLGLYVLIEDINNDFAKDRFGSKSTPIFKPVTYDLFLDLGRDWSAYEKIYDLKTKATEEQLARVMDFAKLVSHADDKEFARKLPEFLDLEEFAAFVAGHALLSSYDGFFTDGQNFYLYLDPDSNKFGFIPWDQDIAWGAFTYLGTAEKRETASIWKPAAYDNHFLNRVMKVKAFRAIYRRKLEEALAGPFTVERLNREIDKVAAVIRPAIAAESQFRLDRFDVAVSTNWVKGPRDGNRKDGTAFGPGAPPHQLKRFIQARIKSVRDQLDGKSEGSRIHGFGD